MGDEPVVALTTQPLTIVTASGGREVRLRGNRTARVLAAVFTVGLAAGAVLWWRAAQRGVHPCGSQSPQACAPAAAVARWGQFLLVFPGLVVAAALVAYGVRFAAFGTTWRRRTALYVAFLVTASVWTAVYAIGALTVR